MHAIGKSCVEIEGSEVRAPGGCYAMTDVDPVESIIIVWGYRDWETDRKSTRLNSSHSAKSRMPSSA